MYISHIIYTQPLLADVRIVISTEPSKVGVLIELNAGLAESANKAAVEEAVLNRSK